MTARLGDDLPPAGLTWGDYVARWVDDRGGWLPLADQLIHRAGDSVEIPPDPQSVERGLRRLARRGHRPGGQYGRWMLRFFGLTSPVAQWVRWLGSYHTRFADLPSGLRLEQLALWNRPPIAESSHACWIHVGMAWAHFSRLELPACEHWLVRAERHAAAAGAAAELEAALLRGELAVARRDHRTVDELLPLLRARLDGADLPEPDALPYRARVEAIFAVRYTQPAPGEPEDLDRGRAHYDAIPPSTIPFVAFRRCLGLAYCAWRRDELDEARRLAQRAADEAGDGGLVRMRVMALNMLARLLPDEHAAEVRARAHRMAVALEAEDLLRRLAPARAAAAR